MDCLGRPFDPATMKAVDIDTQSDAEDGTVLEVYRSGYWWNDTVYRPAEVKVARRAGKERTLNDGSNGGQSLISD